MDFQRCRALGLGARARRADTLSPFWKTQHSEPSGASLSPSCLPTPIYLGWFQDPKPAP